ncbi:MAG: glycine cleavage system aminomethyltransferase GcvT, partial [Microbacterium sp.]|nr:glycine cleavage system aminomethyltransferase GcvT [Microbacterium sp.]
MNDPALSTDPADPRRSPLHARHEALGAQFTDFGGWLMPLRYGSDLAEHHAVRQAAGLFDISHMAELHVSGPDAAAFLDAAVTADATAIAVGRARYAMLLEPDGGIVDDLIVYRLGDAHFLVVANAGNRAPVVEALEARAAGFEVRVHDATETTALVAVQGPQAERILRALPGLNAEDSEPAEALAALRYYAATRMSFDGFPLLVARTGYTGEDGFELFVPVPGAAALWDALLAAGAPFGIVPAGLAARDTLRLEAGMPLYGHELSRDILPAQAGLGRVGPPTKTADFV